MSSLLGFLEVARKYRLEAVEGSVQRATGVAFMILFIELCMYKAVMFHKEYVVYQYSTSTHKW